MSIYRTTITAIFASFLATSAVSQTIGETTIGGGLSIFGPTLQGTYQIEPTVRLRGVAVGGLSYSDTDEDDDGNQYAIDLDIAAAAILFDHFPGGDGWRLSGGLLINLSDLQATGSGAAGEPFEINGQTFSGGSVLAEGEPLRNVAPMVTVGYDHALNDRWILGAEIGVIYMGGVETTFTANSDLLQAEIDSSADFQDFADDARDYPLLPYLGVTISYRF